jgi:nucleoside-diphosphate-sugar epimerase
VLELADLIWTKVHGDAKPFRYAADQPFRYDVQCRIPDVTKARDRLGFEATTTLPEILDELVPWIAEQIQLGVI